jgi:hypothetical protein
MDPAPGAELIARYRAGADAVDAALARAGDEELDAVPKDGGWSPRMVVHHIADSEPNSYPRVRKLLAEDDPVVQGYDQAEYARRLHYDRPVETSLAGSAPFGPPRPSCSSASKAGMGTRRNAHTESGPYTMDDWLEIYAAHAFDHAEQIRRVRGAD